MTRNSAICFLFVLLAIALAPSWGIAQASRVAVVKHNLPEFRDISIWKGRAGLTLFSPDGKYLAVSGKSADVVIYDTETGEIKSKIDGDGFRAFSFSPDGKFVIAQNVRDLSMQIFETENGKSVREIRGLGKLSNINKTLGGGFLSGIVLEMGRVPVTKNWKNILVNKNDKEFSIFDFETGELKFDLQHENFNSGWESTKLVFALLGAAAGTPAGFAFLGSASTSQFSENSRYLLIANGNKKPTLWNIESGSLISKFDAGERVFHSGFSPDGTMVATSDFDGITKVWDTETGQLLSTIGSKKERGIVAAWNRSGSKIFIIPSGKGDLKAYAPQSGTRIYAFEGSMPNSTILNKNSTLFLTTPRKNKAILFQIWDLETGKLIASAPRAKKQGVLISLKWSPDSRMIATSDGLKKEVKIWNTKGEYLQTLSSSTLPMRFSDDGKYLATGGVLPNTKLDTGYLWEFPEVESDERLALKIVRR